MMVTYDDDDDDENDDDICDEDDDNDDINTYDTQLLNYITEFWGFFLQILHILKCFFFFFFGVCPDIV